MSIRIKGMKMPDDCKTCDLCQYDDGFWGFCFANDERIADEGRREDCPLIEVPTPHGRLIDADELIKEINKRIDAAIKWGVNAIADRDEEIKLRAEQAVATFCEASLTTKELPTVVEAEGE